MTSPKSIPITKSLLRQRLNAYYTLPTITDEQPRRNTHPELPRRIGGLFEASVSGSSNSLDNGYHKLTKLLVNLTIERSLGPVHILMSPENTVEDLIKAALDVNVKEKRRPLSTETDPHCFELHYSQFTLESLNPKEKLINLGWRNFFLCSKRTNPVNSLWSDKAKTADADE